MMPMKVTVMRDLGAVASKFYHVLYPKYNSLHCIGPTGMVITALDWEELGWFYYSFF